MAFTPSPCGSHGHVPSHGAYTTGSPWNHRVRMDLRICRPHRLPCGVSQTRTVACLGFFRMSEPTQYCNAEPAARVISRRLLTHSGLGGILNNNQVSAALPSRHRFPVETVPWAHDSRIFLYTVPSVRPLPNVLNGVARRIRSIRAQRSTRVPCTRNPWMGGLFPRLCIVYENQRRLAGSSGNSSALPSSGTPVGNRRNGGPRKKRTHAGQWAVGRGHSPDTQLVLLSVAPDQIDRAVPPPPSTTGRLGVNARQ